MYFTENEDEGTVQEGAETGPNTFTQQEVDEIVEQEENHEVEVNRRNGEEALKVGLQLVVPICLHLHII